MTINKSTAQIINTKDIYIHDDILIFFKFDRLNKSLLLKLQKKEIIHDIEFTNVIGFSMTSCDFWGPSACILDFEYITPENEVLIPELSKKSDGVQNSLCRVRFENFIEVLFTFSSGDTLRIACERIEFA